MGKRKRETLLRWLGSGFTDDSKLFAFLFLACINSEALMGKAEEGFFFACMTKELNPKISIYIEV